MRFHRGLALSCLLVAASACSVSTLAASPDCARWVREYQQALAKRAAAAKHHMVHVAHRLVHPRPHPVHVASTTHRLRPGRLTPHEMLRRFRVLCGDDLPDDALPVSFVPTGLETAMLPAAPALDAPLMTDSGQPVTFTPATPAAQTPGNSTGTTTPYSPIVFPGGGGTTNTGTGTTTTGTGTGTGTIPTTTATPSPVPEPSSLLLLCTGIAATVPLVRRRLRTSAA